MEDVTDFARFAREMGFNKKEIGKVGDLLGLHFSMAGKLNRGERELTRLERLAMAAAMYGLPEWTPEQSPKILAAKRAGEQIAEMAKNMQA